MPTPICVRSSPSSGATGSTAISKWLALSVLFGHRSQHARGDGVEPKKAKIAARVREIKFSLAHSPSSSLIFDRSLRINSIVDECIPFFSPKHVLRACRSKVKF